MRDAELKYGSGEHRGDQDSGCRPGALRVLLAANARPWLRTACGKTVRKTHLGVGQMRVTGLALPCCWSFVWHQSEAWHHPKIPQKLPKTGLAWFLLPMVGC